MIGWTSLRAAMRGRGSPQQTRFFSVVETAGISRPSIWEPHREPKSSCWGRLSIRRTCGNVRSGFRHHDDSCARTTERDSHVLHATREDHDETPPFPFGFFDDEGDELAEERVWQLFALVPRMLMQSPWDWECGPRRTWCEWRILRQGQVVGIVGVRQEFNLHWNTEEAVCQERAGTKRHGNPGAHAEGPGLTIQAGNGSPKRGDFREFRERPQVASRTTLKKDGGVASPQPPRFVGWSRKFWRSNSASSTTSRLRGARSTSHDGEEP